MLSIIINKGLKDIENPNYVFSPDTYFKYNYEDEWFDDGLEYELNLQRNITVIQGDSATGKTTLVQIMSDYLSDRTEPGTEVVCDKKCAVLSGDPESAISRLRSLTDTIVFVDEQERFSMILTEDSN